MAATVEERWQTKIKSTDEAVRHIYETKEFADVTFRVREVRYEAHKLILAARSSELARLLMSHNAPDEIVVDRNSPVTVLGFETLLKFCYTNELDTTNKKAVVEGYLAANHYKQRSLLKWCNSTIESWDIKADEVCDLLDIKWDIPALKDKCISVVRSDGLAVLSSDSFYKASFRSLSVILSSGALKDVPVMQRIVRIMMWGNVQYSIGVDNNDYSKVRERLFNAQPSLLGMLEFEKLDMKELGKVHKAYPNLLTAQEVTQFLLYSSEDDPSRRDTSVLPTWCTLNE